MKIEKDQQQRINEWLTFFDDFPVECDGMTRLISTALSDQKIEHSVKQGYLRGENGSEILHFWIALPGNHIIDLRARMWMGNEAPHGLFKNEGLTVTYDEHGELESFNASGLIFMILSGVDKEDVPPFPRLEAVLSKGNKPNYPSIDM